VEVEQTSLPGVLLIKPKVFGDARGFFLETYSTRRYQEAGIETAFVQDNSSRSSKGVLRGLHYQLQHPQGKLVSVNRGEVFDVAVDIRVGSPTFGQWYGVVLNDSNHHQLYVPPGFAHGFVVMSDIVDFSYKCTDYYHPQDEQGIRWDDPAINIQWPIKTPVLSEKDKVNPVLENQVSNNCLPNYNPTP
jgi:dTDP-4-dehydrorhamnose 3,5-epimerase